MVKLEGTMLTHGINCPSARRHALKHSGLVAVVELTGQLRITSYRNPECLSEGVEAAETLSPELIRNSRWHGRSQPDAGTSEPDACHVLSLPGYGAWVEANIHHDVQGLHTRTSRENKDEVFVLVWVDRADDYAVDLFRWWVDPNLGRLRRAL